MSRLDRMGKHTRVPEIRKAYIKHLTKQRYLQSLEKGLGLTIKACFYMVLKELKIGVIDDIH